MKEGQFMTPFLSVQVHGQTIQVIPEAQYESGMAYMTEQMAPLYREDTVQVKGGTIHAESYLSDDASADLVMLHGYTESACKLKELAWYFVQAGFNVYSYDERGHGRSLRLCEDTSLTDVESFTDYVDDLSCVLEQLVLPRNQGRPLCLFAHSMGGAVGAHFLIKSPSIFSRAVLSSPMIAPSAGSFPLWMGTLMANFFCLTGHQRDRAFIAGPFDPAKELFSTSCDTSEARFSYYRDKRIADPMLQNSSPTYRWVREAANQRHVPLKQAGAITADVLLCQAALDTVVLLPPQDQFIQQVPHGRKAVFEDAKHEIYFSSDSTMLRYVETVISFLKGDQP